jgi:hypothetical protein
MGTPLREIALRAQAGWLVTKLTPECAKQLCPQARRQRKWVTRGRPETIRRW